MYIRTAGGLKMTVGGGAVEEEETSPERARLCLEEFYRKVGK